MTKRRFTHKDKSLYIDDDYFCELEDGDEITELLNRQQYTVETVWKENEQLKQVKKVLKRYYDNYTQMAVDLRDDKYANSMCHDVIEVLCEIADKLGVKLE